MKSSPTSETVRSHLSADARHRSTFLGVVYFSAAWLLFAGTIAAIILTPHWAAKLGLGFAAGLWIGLCFVMGHDACHGNSTPHRKLNRLLGRLAMLPSLHPYASWVHSHNGRHHGFTNIKEKDPGFPPLSLEDYRALPRWRRGVERFYRTFWGLGPLYFFEMWIKWEIWPTGDRKPRNARAFLFDRLVVAAFAAGWIAVLVIGAYWLGENAWLAVFAGFVLPTIVWNYVIANTIYQQHTHPRVPWFRMADQPDYFRTQIQSTPRVILPKSVDFMSYRVMVHTAHHADPTIPLYRIDDAQQRIEREFRRDIVRMLWTPAAYAKTLRTCKLYDYDEHRWLDFAGKPLTGPLVAPAAEPILSGAQE